jgi:tetratricopeptide (TPR) repeat protein
VAFFLFSRYRLPALPGLLLLAALPLVRLVEAGRAGRWRPAVAGGAALAAVWALPHFAGYAPRAELVEYNLGRLHEEAGDILLARTYYQAALRSEPDAFLPALNLGNLAARSGVYEEARGWYERAVAAEPRSPEAWSNLGGALLALGDLDGAARALDRALALDPSYEPARRNRELVERRR